MLSRVTMGWTLKRATLRTMKATKMALLTMTLFHMDLGHEPERIQQTKVAGAKCYRKRMTMTSHW
eukprot:jgi/Phyca11/511498/fgenesh2_kg.PHYCAscaffold_87_\